MAELYHLARPYAKAAFEYADDNKILDQWWQFFQMIEKAILSDELSVYLNHPQVSQKQIVEIVVDALNIQDKAFVNFLNIIAHNKRLNVVGAMSELFAEYKAKKERSVNAVLTSAYEVSEHIIESMKTKLESKFNAQVVLETEVDPTLIGGGIIRVGDLVIDGSVLGNFRRLKQEFMA